MTVREIGVPYDGDVLTWTSGAFITHYCVNKLRRFAGPHTPSP